MNDENNFYQRKNCKTLSYKYEITTTNNNNDFFFHGNAMKIYIDRFDVNRHTPCTINN